jgi:hypothetical protein
MYYSYSYSYSYLLCFLSLLCYDDYYFSISGGGLTITTTKMTSFVVDATNALSGCPECSLNNDELTCNSALTTVTKASYQCLSGLFFETIVIEFSASNVRYCSVKITAGFLSF